MMEHFVAGTTARCASSLVGVNVKTACYYFHRLRELIFEQLERKSKDVFCGEIEVDESYFGGTRKGKRGRGAGGKVPVFGLLKRGGKVYTKIIPDASSTTLLPIIKERPLFFERCRDRHVILCLAVRCHTIFHSFSFLLD